MPQTPRLEEDQIRQHLQAIPQWTREGSIIKRSVTLASFPAAIKLVHAVADAAESADHHPDMDIRFNQVTFALTTHDSGGLTMKDMELARRIDELVPVS